MSCPVVITGMGAVTVFGDGCPALFDALRAGESGLHALRGIAVARGKDRSAQIEDPRRAGTWRLSGMAVDAAREALEQAGGPARGVTGLYVGTTGGENRALEDRWDDFLAARRALESGADPGMDDELAEAMVRFPIGVLADVLAHRLDIAGPRYVATNACASGTIATATALLALRQGTVDRAVVVGADHLKATSYWGAERAGFVGHDLRPFHADRDGSVLGDGAGALVLERAADVAARGGTPLARLAGWAVTCDDNPHAIIPPEDGASNAEAVRLALADAGLTPQEIDYFNAHGTGTPLIDRLETASARLVFGERAGQVPISSTKSLVGHLAAASPIIEAIATVYCLREQWVHPTAKLDRIDPALTLDYVPLRGRPQRIRAAVSNSLGGGGTNAVLALCREDHAPAGDSAAQPVPDVVVTGTGAVSRLGDGPGALEAAYGPNTAPERQRPFSVLDHIDRSQGYHYLSRCAQLGFGAAAQALADAGVAVPLPAEGPLTGRRVAVVMGTAVGGLSAMAETLCPHLSTDPTRITPSMSLDHGPQLAATLVCRAAGITGPMITLISGPIAALQAVEIGRALLAADVCDLVVAGGADAGDVPMRATARLLARRRGRAALEPVDSAACVVLERPAGARERGATVRAVVTGAASWSEPLAPDRTDAAAGALARCLTAVGTGSVDQPHLSYHLGGGNLSDTGEVKLIASGFRAEALGGAQAAGPLLAAVAAVARVTVEPGAAAIVSAVAPGGSAAALRLASPDGRHL
ncbi:beta-ketoacyl-[acyl-carrier-protein] synthase family protein [Streptomyces sp. NPDC048664]|uniref:beta-ketoacyl-[acyl-carrier-protein] synthase family protein n=1 Tax=Streptomyces sp. NPDC048664 TaxID=3154505 RepID=UPI00342CE5C3